jgi:hypothetical protein
LQIGLNLLITLHENILRLQMPRFKIMIDQGQFGARGAHVERTHFVNQLAHSFLGNIGIPSKMEGTQHNT